MVSRSRGKLVAADAAVEIAADGDVAGVAGQLADVVDMVHQLLERHLAVVPGADDPAGDQVGATHQDPDDAAPLDDGLDLLIGELTLVGYQRPAVVMAGQHRSPEAFQRLPEGLVGEVGQVEQHPQPLHLRQQPATRLGQAQLGAGPAGVAPGTAVGRSDHAQARPPPVLELLGPQDRVRALHQQHEAQRGGAPGLRPGGLPGLPLGHVPVQLGPPADDPGVALPLQRPVVGQLAPGHRVGLDRPGVVDVVGHLAGGPGDHRHERQRDLPPAHLRQRHHSLGLALAGDAELGDAGWCRPRRAGRGCLAGRSWARSRWPSMMSMAVLLSLQPCRGVSGRSTKLLPASDCAPEVASGTKW